MAALESISIYDIRCCTININKTMSICLQRHGFLSIGLSAGIKTASNFGSTQHILLNEVRYTCTADNNILMKSCRVDLSFSAVV